MEKAIFLDRDGTINENNGFIKAEEEITINLGVEEALLKLKDKGYKLIVITNQPVIARGIASESKIIELHNFINSKIGNLIDAFYFCPHHPEMHDDVPEHAKKYRIKCECRKPLPGMLIKASKEFDIDLSKSWMIGDTLSDVATGKAAGCHTILVKSPRTGYIEKSGPFFDQNIKPDFYAGDLLYAADIIN